MKLYHGCSREIADIILSEGLIGGDNTHGGNRGVFETPRLFTAYSFAVAQKYGEVLLEINIPEAIFNGMPSITINDGLGDRCEVFEGEGVLIASEYIQEVEKNETLSWM